MNFDHYSIRLLTKEDLDPFFDLIERNRPRLEAFFAGTVARTKTYEDAEQYLAEIVAKASNKTYLPFVLVDENSGDFAGFMDIKNIDWNIPKGELGFFIDSHFEGQKLSRKAFSLFLDHCFSEWGFRKLFLRTHETNIPARRLAEGCGFELEGTLRRDYKTSEGELVDLLYYGKLSEV